jgi:hypothetical protein
VRIHINIFVRKICITILTDKVSRSTLEKVQDGTLAGEEVNVSTIRTRRRISVNVPLLAALLTLTHRIHFPHLFKLYPFYIRHS